MLSGPTTANPARASLAPHKAVSHVLRLSVVSRDRPRRVYAVDEGALEKACAGARSFNGCDSAVGGAQEAVNHEAGVRVSSRNRLPLIESCRENLPRPRNIKRGEDPMFIAQEEMPRAADVLVVSRNRSVRVDGSRIA